MHPCTMCLLCVRLHGRCVAGSGDTQIIMESSFVQNAVPSAPLSAHAVPPPLPQPLDTTPISPQNFDGVFAALDAGGPAISSTILEAEEAAAEAALLEPLPTLSATAASPSPPPPLTIAHELTGFDGRPLRATSEALDARCQSAVNSLLDRSMATGNDALPPMYADALEGVQVGPVNGTDDVRIVYVIGVGARRFAHLVASRLLYALYSPTHLFLIHLDVKADKECAAAMYALARQHPNVRVLQARRLVQWGMFSMVAILLDAISTLIKCVRPTRLDAPTPRSSSAHPCCPPVLRFGCSPLMLGRSRPRSQGQSPIRLPN